MSDSMSSNDNIIDFNHQGFDNGNFYIENSYNNERIIIDTPIIIDEEFKNKEFDVFFFVKKNIKENDIFQVYERVRSERIGWLIPINSLESNEHDYFKNEFFLKYAYVGIIEALKKLDKTIYTKPIVLRNGSLKLSDIFHESTVLLIISKEKLENGKPFNIDRALPSFIRYGYVKLSNMNPNDIEFDGNELPRDIIKVDYISESINNYQLISDILNFSFAYEKKTIIQFFFLYQIIELLLEHVYSAEQKEIIDRLISAKDDSGKAKEALEKMQSLLSEKKRISIMISKYTKLGSELVTLKNSCNKLLRTIGREEGEDFSKYFYSIRNFIFHQYRDFPDSSIELLGEVNSDVLEVLPILLAKYNQN